MEQEPWLEYMPLCLFTSPFICAIAIVIFVAVAVYVYQRWRKRGKQRSKNSDTDFPPYLSPTEETPPKKSSSDQQ